MLGTAAVVDDELALPRRHKARQDAVLQRGADMPARPQIERAERARPEPIRYLERRQDSDGPGQARPRRTERQEQEFQIDWLAVRILGRNGGNGAEPFLLDDRDQGG